MLPAYPTSDQDRSLFSFMKLISSKILFEKMLSYNLTKIKQALKMTWKYATPLCSREMFKRQIARFVLNLVTKL